MQIFKISPRGYCYGVIDALKIVMQTLKLNSNKTIYMLGLFVHNPEMIKEFDSKINILDDTYLSRYELVDNLPYANNGEIIILSAHGTDLKTIHLALKKGYKVINTTCKYVYKTHELINQSLNDKHNVIFIGKSNHPETNAILSIDKNIIFIDYQCNNYNIQIDNHYPIDVYNQTTLSIFDINHIHNKLKNSFPNINIFNDICDATTQRQKALFDFDVPVDLFLVIGHHKSSNSNELLKIARSKNINSYLINSINDINLKWLEGVNKVAITSGTSTPTHLTNSIINFLKEY